MRIEQVVLVIYNFSRLSKSTEHICLSLVPCFWGHYYYLNQCGGSKY